jgi:hypothetical protein
MWSIISRFLLWVPIAIGGIIAFWVGSLLVAATIWDGAKREAEAEWAWLASAMTSAWILCGLVVFALLWLVAYLWAEHQKTRPKVANQEVALRGRALAFADILRGRIDLANDALDPVDGDKLENWHTKAKRQQLFIDDRLETIAVGQLPAVLTHKLELSIALVKELNEIARQIGSGEGGATPAQRVGAYRHCAVKLYRQLAEIAGIDADWRVSKAGLAPVRDVGLAEALAYAELGQWGKSFFDAASAAMNEANEQLERFRQLAHDGVLTVWGKRTENGVFQLIPKDHWIDHHVEWFDLLRGKARTENVRNTHAEPISELMVSKAEFEREWPHAQG